jgi:hypothetical protein
MLDLHALSSGGGTSLTNIGTIAAGGDGQVVAGVPIASGATLVSWGGLTTIADTIKELKLNSQDLLDNPNGLDFLSGGAALGIKNIYTQLPYGLGQRAIGMSQNTAGANNLGYFLDYYPGPPGIIQGPSLLTGNNATEGDYSTTYSGALTAITWKSQAFNPSTAIPAGRYAILGAEVSALTNYALLRFQHADFGPFLPGFPVVDPNVAVARAVAPPDPLLFNYPLYQFSFLSQLLGKPVEPIFTVGPGNTGLSFQVIAITADTPQVNIRLMKVG